MPPVLFFYSLPSLKDPPITRTIPTMPQNRARVGKGKLGTLLYGMASSASIQQNKKPSNIKLIPNT